MIFKINFRITDNKKKLNLLTNQEIQEGGHIEGYFEIIINNKKYGYCKEGALGFSEQGSELLTPWFESLLNVLALLNDGYEYVAINNLDSYNEWLEFKKVHANNICISVFEAEKENGCKEVVTLKPKDAHYRDLIDEIVNYTDLQKEIVQSVNLYLCTLETLNPKLITGNRLFLLKKLVDEISHGPKHKNHNV